jgi:two-component system sensor histidine kinase YesM
MRQPKAWLGFVNDIPITWKFILIFILCVLIPILTINALFFQQISQYARAREETNIRMTLDRVSKKVMDIVQGGVAVSHSIATDRSLYEALDFHYPGLVDFYDTYASSLRDKMKPYLSAYPYIENISIYTGNASIANGGNYLILDQTEKDAEWFPELVQSPGVRVFVHLGADPLNVKNPKAYFSVFRKLNEYPIYNRYEKYLKIDIKVANIDEILRQEKPYLELSIKDGEGRSVFPSASFLSASKPEIPPTKTEEKLTYASELGTPSYLTGWRVVGAANANLFQTQQAESERYIWMLALISTLVPTSLIFIILRSYIYRVKRLSRHMDKAQNEKFVPINLPEGKDEIGGLIRSFNRMTSTIESLINDVYKLEIQQKDLQLEQVRAELKLLQSQVNPHFLFNTLNALFVVSAKKGYDEVTDTIKSLSQLLRRMLSWSDEPVTVEEELRFTEMYLKIEKFRFTERFDYRFDTDEASISCLVPKMCIQPLVENACKHGLQSVKGRRFIRIETRKIGPYVTVLVEDNGIGIDEARLSEIRAQMNEGLDADENVGLRNVYKRLKLHYGERVDFDIASGTGEGTRIVFRIPAMPASGEEETDYVYGAAGRR